MIFSRLHQATSDDPVAKSFAFSKRNEAFLSCLLGAGNEDFLSFSSSPSVAIHCLLFCFFLSCQLCDAKLYLCDMVPRSLKMALGLTLWICPVSYVSWETLLRLWLHSFWCLSNPCTQQLQPVLFPASVWRMGTSTNYTGHLNNVQMGL